MAARLRTVSHRLFLYGLVGRWPLLGRRRAIGAIRDRRHIWQPVSYMYLPICGFFYLAEWLPPSWRDVAFDRIPSLHALRMIRGGLFGDRIEAFYDIPILSLILAILTVIGLWLLRDVRKARSP